MAYPNSPRWSALQDGATVTVDGAPYRLSVVDCGMLVMPFGQLVACEPFAFLEPEDWPFTAVPPGRYPVRVTLADISEAGDGSHIREAYATLLLAENPEVCRRIITPLPDGEIAPPEMEGDSYFGFPVDAGTACFVDRGALAEGLPPPADWYTELFDTGRPDSWFAQMDDPNHLRPGLANTALPNNPHRANIVVIHSGWGDGVYPVVGGYDAAGHLVRVHIDFLVIPPADDAAPQ